MFAAARSETDRPAIFESMSGDRCLAQQDMKIRCMLQTWRSLLGCNGTKIANLGDDMQQLQRVEAKGIWSEKFLSFDRVI